MAKFRVSALLILIAVISCAAGALISVSVVGRAGAAADPSPATDAIADADGALRVPKDYRSMYEYLGTWAIAADKGEGSKQLHSVYASPGAVAAFRANGHFPDGAVLVKEVYESTTSPMTTGTVSHAETSRGLVHHGQGQQEQPSAKQAMGQRMGLVVVRRRQSHEDNVDRLHVGLPALPHSRTGDGLDLHPRVSSSAQMICGPMLKSLTAGANPPRPGLRRAQRRTGCAPLSVGI